MAKSFQVEDNNKPNLAGFTMARCHRQCSFAMQRKGATGKAYLGSSHYKDNLPIMGYMGNVSYKYCNSSFNSLFSRKKWVSMSNYTCVGLWS